jgi:hypothetical protein
MGATQARDDATGGAASGELLAKTSTIGAIGRYCVVALAAIPVAPVFGARVVIIAVDAVFAAIAIIANIVSARDTVVALFVGRTLRLLFADAVNAETGSTVPVAGATFGVPRIGIARLGAEIADVIGALVAVVAVFFGRTLRRLHFAEAAQTDTGNAVGLAGCSVVHPAERVIPPRNRGAHATDTSTVDAFVVVAVVAGVPLP